MWFLACMQNSTPPCNDVIVPKTVHCDILVYKYGLIKFYKFHFLNNPWAMFSHAKSTATMLGVIMDGCQGVAKVFGVYHLKRVQWYSGL